MYVFVYRMVNEFSIVFLTFSATGIILNGVGLILLYSFKNGGIDLTQKYILINLCLNNFILSIFLTTQQTLYPLETDPQRSQFFLDLCTEILCSGFYFATFWLIFDRYLHIKLNIKYVIYWSRRKTIIAVMILWSLAALNGSIFAIYAFEHDVFFFAAFDLVIITFSTYVYGYALLLLKLHRSNIRSNQQGRSIFKGLFLSAIILLTFLLLDVIPDTIMMVQAINGISYNSDKLIWYTWLIYPVSLWTDALIYIFVSPHIRFALKKNMKRLLVNMLRATTKSKEPYFIKPLEISTANQIKKVILV